MPFREALQKAITGITEGFLGPEPKLTPYGTLVAGIQNLHDNGDPVREMRFAEQLVTVDKLGLHGFTIDEIDWTTVSLSEVAKNFLKEGTASNRLSVYTNVFSVSDVPRLPEMRGGYYGWGERKHHILWLSTPARELEIEAERLFAVQPTLIEMLTPAFNLAVRFLTIGKDGMIVRQGDPRDFSVEFGNPSPEQMEFVAGVLQFALTEK